MKGFILWVCVFIFASSSSSKLKEEKHINTNVRAIQDEIKPCLSEIGIAYEALYPPAEIIANVHTQPANKERTKNHGCFMACVLKKQNLIEGTNIKEAQLYSRLHEILDEELDGPGHQIIRKCMEEVRNMTQECEKGFSLYVCIVKEAAAHEEEAKRQKNKKN
ncbi:pheromone-binding protein Gp-9 [Solenopsis invicta]|uniref:pheromone-binding protein Gp-9 n=1 Tax=Solenopsis invicta TaxID=13686 RepID=UPI00193CFD95|nr:pheromone-binding protein Gp-9 [Solenopsis invicta]XP_039307007.1 pheromone-binding protein Gp-9 [Solenopsis invicta]